MEIIIHVDEKKLDKNMQQAVDEYIKRTSPYCKVIIKCYKDINKISFKASSMVYIITPGCDSPTSPGLAKLIEDNNLNGISCIEFVITNNYNYNKQQNYNSFNISSFSMSSQLTSVVLTEQIYRAYTIMNNITYHK